jgi:hypothetical protein
MNPHVYGANPAPSAPPDPADQSASTPVSLPQTKEDIRLESDLQWLCESELNRNGIEYLHLSPRAREKKGWPDLVFAINRVPYAVELKAPGGKLSEDQERRLSRMGNPTNGWVMRVLRSFEEFHRLVADALRDVK